MRPDTMINRQVVIGSKTFPARAAAQWLEELQDEMPVDSVLRFSGA